jgi:predicted RecA/RadA family phage recombinase
LAGEDSGSSIQMSKISAVRLSSARAGSSGEQVRSRRIGERWDLPDFIEL